MTQTKQETTIEILRTHTCGELQLQHEGKYVCLCGWVNKSRNLGGLYFIDLRDKYGVTQLNFRNFQGEISLLKSSHLESVIMAQGKVARRPKEAQNKSMKTGEIEVVVDKLELLSPCRAGALPFLPHGPTEPTEDLRLKYRYLDLRTFRLQEMLKKRSQVMTSVRNLLTQKKFIEVETPLLYKSTPEGARDYIVPSREYPHHVYALPQSPQILKQLLMIGGTDKYFQICRCFRDEDLRADRGPEFTQIDIEASFISQNYIKKLVECVIETIFDLKPHFEMDRMTYNQAISDYGTDKPDLRFNLKHLNVTEVFKHSSFSLFENIANKNGLIKSIFVPKNFGTFSRKDTDSLSEIVRSYGGEGVAFFKVHEGKRTGGLSKFITDDNFSALESLKKDHGDGTWLFIANKSHNVAHACADVLRRHLGEVFNLKGSKYCFVWIDDFPLLEWNEEEERFYAKHHPFTAPKDQDRERFFTDDRQVLLETKAQAYDVVCNGYELGGGSMRIYQEDVQKRMFHVLGMNQEEVERQFGLFIQALQYGTPPHGGIALGLDRIMMILTKTDSMRDVLAFPKTTKAYDLTVKTPARPSDKQLRELFFRWV